MKKFLCILLLFMSMGTMYYFSSQDGQTSSNQSNTVIEIIDEIREKVTLKDERLITLKNKVIDELRKYGKSYVVRKAAHFGIYAIIGGVMMIMIYLLSKRVFLSASLSLLATIVFAIFDERRQLGIPGRNGNLTDVFIDGSGALLAIIILSVLFLSAKGVGFVFGKKYE